jgi:hypothetical protein
MNAKRRMNSRIPRTTAEARQNICEETGLQVVLDPYKACLGTLGPACNPSRDLLVCGFVCSWTAGGTRAPLMQHSIVRFLLRASAVDFVRVCFFVEQISSIRSVVVWHETTKMKFEKEKYPRVPS